MGGSRSGAPMAMSPSLTKGWIASNACSGPFPLLSGRRWDGSFARREAPGGVGAFALCAMEG